MDDRLKLGNEVHELKLGASFASSSSNSAETFHTIKYDFKPASVDTNKAAKLEMSNNYQVTVTVPHLDTSGVPNTVFKGNSRDYSKKECVLIIDRDTGQFILERLGGNIQVKKTRSESHAKPQPPPPPMPKIENNTQRQSNKTKVSTGLRKNAPISYVPKQSPVQHSPTSAPHPRHKSPETAPQWNANNTQQTLPSIPIIGDDYEPIPNSRVATNSLPASLLQPSRSSVAASVAAASSSAATAMSKGLHMLEDGMGGLSKGMSLLEDNVGVLSDSDSDESSSSSSDSGSDSDSSASSPPPKTTAAAGAFANGSIPTQLLNEDLCLSDSNSSDSDD